MKTLFLALFFSATALASNTDSGSVYNLNSNWTDQDGKSVTLSRLKGRPVVMAMAYTSCPVACPMTISEMKAIENSLPEMERARIQFLLVSFDSERDTVRELKNYSVKRNLMAPAWTLLTGRSEDVRDLAAVLGIKYKRDASGGYAHSNLITILDAQGVIQKQRNGFGGGPKEMAALLSKLLR